MLGKYQYLLTHRNDPLSLSTQYLSYFPRDAMPDGDKCIVTCPKGKSSASTRPPLEGASRVPVVPSLRVLCTLGIFEFFNSPSILLHSIASSPLTTTPNPAEIRSLLSAAVHNGSNHTSEATLLDATFPASFMDRIRLNGC